VFAKSNFNIALLRWQTLGDGFCQLMTATACCHGPSATWPAATSEWQHRHVMPEIE